MAARLAFALAALASLAYAGGPGVQNDVNCDGTDTFNTIDLLSIINATVTNNFQQQISDPFSLTASASQEFGVGSAQLCIANDFLFENTHIFLHDLAQGGFNIASTCCDVTSNSSSGTCNGGHVTINGDSGLATILQVTSTSVECGGSFQFDTTASSTIATDIVTGIGNFFKTIAGFFSSDDD